MHRVHPGLVAAPLGAVVLLLGLVATVGSAPWAAMVTVVAALAVAALLGRALARTGAPLGPANAVTLVRAVLTCGVAGLAVQPLAGPPAARSAVVVLGAAALALDAVDGVVARRTGTVSALGARFDLEADALLVLALSAVVARDLGAWVLLLGLARYLLLGAQWALPALRGAVRTRHWRKVVAAVQGVTLLVAASGLLHRGAATAALLVALALLTLSFGTEAVELLRGPGRPRAWRPATASALGVLVLWAALLVPAGPGTPGESAGGVRSWAVLPVEALVLVVLAVVLPARTGRAVALVAGLVAGCLVVLTVLDVAFPAVLDRSFDVLGDWGYLVSAVGVLADGSGRVAAGAAAIGAVVAALAVVAAVAWASRRTTALAHRNRATAGPLVAVTAGVALLAGATLPPPGAGHVLSTAATRLLVEEVSATRAALADPDAFAREIADDPFAAAPSGTLLDRLRGKDVLVVFVESYGRIALEDRVIEPEVGRALEEGSRDLEGAGYSARSAFLTSPTFGGGSWLAHSTLQSGVWVDSQRRHDQLMASGRLTLTGAFGAAGWRTVIDAPAVTRDWPEASTFYRADTLHDARTSGYAGPAFGYATAPDQYTLAHLGRVELRHGDRPRVMAEVDLVSSHHPWAPLPRLVPWDRVGDGSVFRGMPEQGEDAAHALATSSRARQAYARSVTYSLRSVTTFLRTLAGDDLVVVVVGDHQPHHYVSGDDPGRDVPVTVVARDPEVLRAVDGWAWQPGLRPGPDAPVWRMDAFRDRFLAAFSTSAPGGR